MEILIMVSKSFIDAFWATVIVINFGNLSVVFVDFVVVVVACSLLLNILYLVDVNKVNLRLPKAVEIVVDVNVVVVFVTVAVVALLVVTGHIMFSCGQ